MSFFIHSFRFFGYRMQTIINIIGNRLKISLHCDQESALPFWALVLEMFFFYTRKKKLGLWFGAINKYASYDFNINGSWVKHKIFWRQRNVSVNVDSEEHRPQMTRSVHINHTCPPLSLFQINRNMKVWTLKIFLRGILHVSTASKRRFRFYYKDRETLGKINERSASCSCTAWPCSVNCCRFTASGNAVLLTRIA